MSKPRGRTATEILARISADPQKRAALEGRQRQVAAREAELLAESQPILHELNGSGLVTSAFWDIRPEDRARAVPILLRHLSASYSQQLRWGIAVALGVPEARVGWRTLLEAFSRESDRRVRSALAGALGIAATDAEMDDVIALVEDRSAGEDRRLFLSALGRSNDLRAESVLQTLSKDAALKSEAQKELKAWARRRRERHEIAPTPVRTPPQRVENDSEVSANFDADNLQPFFERLSRLVGGFGTAEIAKIVSMTGSLEPDQEDELSVRVVCGEKPTQLRIRVFADDNDSFDVYLFGPAELTERIRQLMDGIDQSTKLSKRGPKS